METLCGVAIEVNSITDFFNILWLTTTQSENVKHNSISELNQMGADICLSFSIKKS
jgi:hypothetical protein